MAIMRIRDKDGKIQEILVIKGEPGDDYVLTPEDKEEIASMISGGGGVSTVLNEHIANEDNPHNVTAEHVGAATQEQVNTALGEAKAYTDAVADGLMTYEEYISELYFEIESAITTSAEDGGLREILIETVLEYLPIYDGEVVE